MNFFQDDVMTMSRRELKYKADFVLDLRIVDFAIMAKIRASIEDKNYNVKLTVDGNGGIVERECECPRGSWICSHMAATAIFIKERGISKTDLLNAWIAKPKKAAKCESRTFGDLLPNLRPEYKATGRAVTTTD